jgi:DUF917 family protein
MKKLFLEDLESICFGASVLGSGGGGHPKILQDYVHYLFDKHQSISLISVDELHTKHLVVPIAFVGAPLIALERLPNSICFDKILQKIQQDYPNREIVLMPAEIGGCNALTPFVLALKHQLPILDADLIGRAFPKINMCKPAVLNAPNPKTYLSCHLGNLITLDLQTQDLVEDLIRASVVHFGSSAIIATFLFEGHAHSNYVIPGSLSRCLELAKTKNHGRKVIDGMIKNVFHEMNHGFLMGEVEIQSKNDMYSIHFQNEYLYIQQNQTITDGSPDIIVIMEKKTQKPLSTDALRYGLEIEVYILEAPDFWKQPKHCQHVHFKQFLSSTLAEQL